ncbi:hypothetical protein N7489_003886 [Penicillium chrysogenum]|uniref:uncharacterized protein n=1 Tax=Penicillium chrysogenum TaxID=5076 RepID=UPI0024DF0AC8|nr:uncharacterized protein N7489_003886 [Penicillium chrysogenum]KAJ5243790.1 hypothetical protein N7489_003886 [Penicillium chrysogenum]KAJ6140867.1 hypothetical protein N7497_011760 [Penicillium chrysogenum]
MTFTGVRAFHPTPEEDPERERICDLSSDESIPSHRETTSEEETPIAPTGDEQPVGCELAKDITLNAPAQLGVLRSNANRSFVSIIDGETQHIIAEMTGSVSLRGTATNQRWYLSWSTVVGSGAGRGMEDINTSNVTANRTRYIIRDFTLGDSFKDRPCAREWPRMRFYAEVPLFSASRYVLGSYCIIDDKPRTDFGDDQVNDLQEVADSIGLHLENVRMSQAHIRTGKIGQGLDRFC